MSQHHSTPAESATSSTKPGGQPGQPPTPLTEGPPNKPGKYDPDDANAGAAKPPADTTIEDEEHEGGTEEQIGDLTGPGAGYDDEPTQEKDGGGVA
ncbi:MAG: hypothetical protein ABI652_07185 [Acidobacteriota bacterium]